jgi:hypothetical protein
MFATDNIDQVLSEVYVAGQNAGTIKFPDLSSLLMPPEQVKARLEGIGGSDANIILSGDEEQVLKLWRVSVARCRRRICQTSSL